jgi:small conductance mechanosensitive channel
MWEIILPLVRAFLNAILLSLGGVLITILGVQTTTRLFSRWISPFWSKFIGSLVGLALLMWTIKIVLDSSGAAGLAVVLITAITGSFALGSSMLSSDLVAGVSLFFARPYEVGHKINVAENEGIVTQISLFLTVLESIQGDKIYVRNSEIVNHTIVNYSTNPGHLISIVIHLPSNQNLKTALEAINKAIAKFTPEITDKNRQPVVLVETMDGDRIIIEVRAYVMEHYDYSTEKTRLFTLSTNALLEAGISL